MFSNLSISFNPINLFSSIGHLICIKASNILITEVTDYEKQAQNDGEGEAEKNNGTDLIHRSLLISALHTITHKIGLYFNKIEYKIPSLKLEGEVKDVYCVYKRVLGSNISIGYSWMSVKYAEIGVVEFGMGNYELLIDETAVLRLINSAKFMYFANVSISNFCICSSEDALKIYSFSIVFDQFPGKYILKIPEVKVKLPEKIPSASISVRSIAVDLVYPLYKISHLETNQIMVGIEDLTMSVYSDQFIYINKIKISKKDMLVGEPIYLIDELNINYSSFDGLELFPIIKRLRGPPTKAADHVFNLPDIDFSVSVINVKLDLTENAKINMKSGQFTFNKGIFSFPRVSIYINSVPMIKAIKLLIYSGDKKFLDISADKLVLHHRNKVNIADFIDNVLYSWSIVKKYISSGIFDDETIPFPFRIAIPALSFKFDDDIINATYQGLNKYMPNLMKESVVMKYILNLKEELCHFNEHQKEMANERLGDLIFKKFREERGNMKIFKKISLDIKNLFAELDSTDYVDKVSKIHQYDPAVKEFYSECKWETLEGFITDISIESLSIKCFDLPEPIISANNFSIKGPIIFGEVESPMCVDVKFHVGTKEFISPKSVGDVKFYGDIKLKASSIVVFYGTALNKIYDEFADAFGELIPDGFNPSPPLRWWDKLRSFYRGPLNLAFDRLVLEFLGTSNPYEMSDKLSFILGNGNLDLIESVVTLEADTFQGIRCNNGPVMIHFPKFSAKATFIWQTENQEQRKHIMIPDPNKFNEVNYDSYMPFRAQGYDIDIEFNFSSNEFVPFISVDYAHLRWLINPIVLLCDTPILDNSYQHKFGSPIKPNAPFMTLSSLNRITTYRFRVPLLSVRFFDHFPTHYEAAINGTSVDVTFINPDFSCITEFPLNGEDLYDIGLKSSCIQINLTDLSEYTKYTTIDSSTFMVINDLDARYGNTSKVDTGTIFIYYNQLFSKYITEFVSSIIHIVNSQHEKKSEVKGTSGKSMKDMLGISNKDDQPVTEKETDLLSQLTRRRSSQRIVTVHGKNAANRKSEQIDNLDLFPQILFTAKIPLIKVVVESMMYESNLLAIVKGADLVFKVNDTTGFYAADANLKTASIYINCGFQVVDEELPSSIAFIDTIKLLYYQHYLNGIKCDNLMDINIDQLTANANTNQIAIIKQILFEVIPETPTNEKKLELAAEDYISLKINLELTQCQMDLRDQFSVELCIVALSRTRCNIVCTLKGNSEYTFTFENLFMKDLRKDAKFSGIVLMRWMDMTSTDSPHLRVQMKTAPPVGGIPIFNQIEINIDPTTFNYDAEFAEIIQNLLTAKIIAPTTGAVNKYLHSDVCVLHPTVLIAQGVLHKIGQSCTEFLKEYKSSEINVMVDRAEKAHLFRYFKVTTTKINVSYRNEDNSIISEINEFNGELHDIIYQDLSESFGGLVTKLISTITRDMIPQFIKHFIGLGKLSPAKESEYEQWISKEQGSSIEKKKLLIFGKSSQK